MITIEDIQKVDCLVARSGVHQLVKEGHLVAILRAVFVKIGEVLAHSPIAVGFRHQNRITQPGRELDLPDDPCLEQLADLSFHPFLPGLVVDSSLLLEWPDRGVDAQSVHCY